MCRLSRPLGRDCRLAARCLHAGTGEGAMQTDKPVRAAKRHSIKSPPTRPLATVWHRLAQARCARLRWQGHTLEGARRDHERCRGGRRTVEDARCNAPTVRARRENARRMKGKKKERCPVGCRRKGDAPALSLLADDRAAASAATIALSTFSSSSATSATTPSRVAAAVAATTLDDGPAASVAAESAVAAAAATASTAAAPEGVVVVLPSRLLRRASVHHVVARIRAVGALGRVLCGAMALRVLAVEMRPLRVSTVGAEAIMCFQAIAFTARPAPDVVAMETIAFRDPPTRRLNGCSGRRSGGNGELRNSGPSGVGRLRRGRETGLVGRKTDLRG